MKKGGCGIDIRTHQAREVLLRTIIGTAAHSKHARHLFDHFSEMFGDDLPIDAGTEVEVEAPITRLVTGIKPKTLADFKEVLEYIESQITALLSAVAMGQEGDHLDFESKSFHAGMIDNLALEVADIIQMSAYNFPRGEPDTALIDIGVGTVDVSKPLILSIGHNVSASVEIINYLRRNGLMDSLEVTGLCCTAQDLARYSDQTKIIGPISRQLKFIRSGIADVIVIDEQCIHTNILQEAQEIKTPLIAVNDQMCLGLPDMTEEPVGNIVNALVTGQHPGVLILDHSKVGEVAVQTALMIAPIRKKYKTVPDAKTLIELAEKCIDCERCRRNCPLDLLIDKAVYEARTGNLKKLADIYDLCIGCGRCESECTPKIPIISLMEKAAEQKIKFEKHKIRAGRGFIKDTEIRKVGRPIVLGQIPGIIAFSGCPTYPRGGIEVGEMAEEYLKRKYIVVTSGCSAMSIAQYENEEGKTLYEAYPGDFDAGCLANVGSCISNAHIIGAAIKIANIFARRPLRANYEEIADYILNRIGAVVMLWGSTSQKALSISTGANRLGIPVIIGPQGSKYRKMLLGRKEKKDKYMVYDARTGERIFIGPAPEHLVYTAESKAEALVMGAKLCIKPNDTTMGRQIKLTNYIDLHKRYFGTMPDDIHLLVRSEADVPFTMKEEILSFLKEKEWQPNIIPDPTLLKRMIRVRK
jgi:acetyl-CoA decarbonylase/synthase complex subunit alpha